MLTPPKVGTGGLEPPTTIVSEWDSTIELRSNKNPPKHLIQGDYFNNLFLN
jgi:hypothetical protein